MYNSIGELDNQTFSSSRKSIEGYYFYDSLKGAWFKITKASLVFVSFEYAFGARWSSRRHLIESVERCSKKFSEHLMSCHKIEFNNLK